MATQFRDTACGQLIRLLSRKKLLRYPDEVDPALWKIFTHQQSSTEELVGSSDDVAVEAAPPAQRGGDDPEKNADYGRRSSAQVKTDEASHDPLKGTLSSQRADDGQDFYIVDWYGPGDPENPLNWSEGWKFLIAAEVCILNFSVYVASSLYVPGEESLQKEFGVSTVVATLGLSLFSVGYGFGPMLWSPLSEFPSIGRSPIYLYTLLAFVLLQLPTGFAVNIAMFLVFRTLSGFVGSPILATGGATIGDTYGPARAAYGICIWATFGVFGPVFGPLIGGFIAPVKGWRWTIWVFTFLNAFGVIMIFFLMPETNPANILYRRARRLREATGEHKLRSQSEIDMAHHTIRDSLALLGRAFTLTFTEPIVFLVDLYTALLYGVLFIWFESFPLVFGGIYGFSIQSQGLVFLGIFVGGLITVPFYLLWVGRVLLPSVGKPTFRPEHVLPPTWAGALSLPVCLFFYGWTARASIHWIVPIIGSSFFTVALVTFFNGILNYLGMSYPAYTASVFAGNGLFRALFGAVFPLFARALFSSLGIGPGNSLLGGIAVLFLPINFLMYFHGAKLRGVSKNAKHDD
ncbi:major facilitator superfamily domain-containing protein [Nemania serpens]|nr:major facilitator superfamily domain-containing protein [Nemania serpens]